MQTLFCASSSIDHALHFLLVLLLIFGAAIILRPLLFFFLLLFCLQLLALYFGVYFEDDFAADFQIVEDPRLLTASKLLVLEYFDKPSKIRIVNKLVN